MKTKSIRRKMCELLLDIVRRSLLGIVAVAIFFESCTKYEAFPPQELPARERGLEPVAGADDSQHIALPLSAEDIDYWRGLHTVLQQVLSNPQWAEAYLGMETVAIGGIERPVVLDEFTKSLLRLFADHDLRAAIARRDYDAMIRCMESHRNEICVTEDAQRRIDAVLKANPKLAELQPNSLVVGFVAIAVVVLAAAAWVAVAAAGETLVGVHYLAMCSQRTLPCDEKMPIYSMALALMAEHPEASIEAIEHMRENEIERIMQALRTHRDDLVEKLGEDGLRELVEQLL